MSLLSNVIDVYHMNINIYYTIYGALLWFIVVLSGTMAFSKELVGDVVWTTTTTDVMWML